MKSLKRLSCLDYILLYKSCQHTSFIFIRYFQKFIKTRHSSLAATEKHARLIDSRVFYVLFLLLLPIFAVCLVDRRNIKELDVLVLFLHAA